MREVTVDVEEIEAAIKEISDNIDELLKTTPPARLTTEVRQVHLGRSLDPTCMFCNAHPKDVGHIFFTCQFTKHLWNAFSRNEAFTDRLIEEIKNSSGSYAEFSLFLLVKFLKIAKSYLLIAV
ncbi:hypothetical protein NC652_027506 [Populus alba x Populus x berolinensis]|nr:hypothetical protein NC652_027506 [Populus alba x Populus x berolinensis]